MLSKIIIIENDNKVQCDSEEEVIKLLIDKRYYELSEKEKLEKREMKAIANCINNSFEIVENVNSKLLKYSPKIYKGLKERISTKKLDKKYLQEKNGVNGGRLWKLWKK